MSQADTLAKNGIQNAAALVTAAAQTGVPLYIAAAFVQHESGGANVFGHDGGGAYSGGGTVTQSKYNAFLKMVRAGHISNGVGPFQITYPGYFKPNTAEVAGLWQPLNNMVFGLKIIRGYLAGNYSDANLNAAGQRYNSGSANGAPAYGSLTVELAHKWAKLLGTDIPSSTTIHTGSKLAVDGLLGPSTIARWQQVCGTKADGVISTGGSQLVESQQRFLNAHGITDKGGRKLVVDGVGIYTNTAGATKASHTQEALQKYWGTTVDGVFSHPSSAVKELQRRLNNHK